MRKTITRFSAVLAFALLYSSAFSQVFFTENFEGTMNAATDLPPNWTETGLSTDGIWSTDNATNASSPYLTYPTPATGTIFAFTNDDECNCNKSNDRMFLPVQNFGSYTGVNLQFSLYLNGGYGEEGFVLVSNNAGASFDTVYTGVGNATAWQNNVSVNLSPYAGDTAVLICFAYNDGGNWAYSMGVDNVELSQLASAEDLESIAAAGEYTLIPLPMATSMPLSAVVTNNGVTNATDVVVTSNVWSSSNGFSTPIQTTTSGNTIVNVNDTVTINTGTFTPSAIETYIFQHIVSSLALIDGQPANDTVEYMFQMTALDYARDDSVPTIGLGITGTGNTGILGVNYNFPVAAALSNVLVGLNGVLQGDSIAIQVFNTNGAGMPTTMVARQIHLCANDGPTLETISFPSGLNLPAGNYFFGVEEFTSVSNNGLMGTNSIFTPNTGWGSINAGPFDAIENLGFAVTFIVRPHLAPPCSNSSSTVNASICDGDVYQIGTSSYTTAGTYVDTLTVPGGCDSVVTTILAVNSLPAVSFSGLSSNYCDTSAVATLTGTPSGGTFMGAGVTGSTFNPGTAGAGIHSISYTYTDPMGCTNADTMSTEVTICVGIENGLFGYVQVSPNPNHGQFTMNGLEAGMEIRMFDMQGKVVLETVANSNVERINLQDQPAGIYFLQVTFEGKVAQMKMVIE